jgi:hypothetical protein
MTTRRTRKTKKTRKTTGVNRGILLVCLALGLVWLPAPGQKSRQPSPQAVIAGTIFREPGFAVAGAEAVLTADTPPAGQKRFRPIRTTTSARGEFFFYLPAAAAKYRVKASARGLEPQEREFEIHGEERVDLYFNLKPLAQ